MNRLLNITLRAIAYAIVLHDRYIDWLINSPAEIIPGTNRSVKAERTLYPFAGSLFVFLLSVGFPRVFNVWVIVLSGLALVVSGYFAVVVIRDVYARPKE